MEIMCRAEEAGTETWASWVVELKIEASPGCLRVLRAGKVLQDLQIGIVRGKAGRDAAEAGSSLFAVCSPEPLKKKALKDKLSWIFDHASKLSLKKRGPPVVFSIGDVDPVDYVHMAEWGYWAELPDEDLQSEDEAESEAECEDDAQSEAESEESAFPWVEDAPMDASEGEGESAEREEPVPEPRPAEASSSALAVPGPDFTVHLEKVTYSDLLKKARETKNYPENNMGFLEVLKEREAERDAEFRREVMKRRIKWLSAGEDDNPQPEPFIWHKRRHLPENRRITYIEHVIAEEKLEKDKVTFIRFLEIWVQLMRDGMGKTSEDIKHDGNLVTQALEAWSRWKKLPEKQQKKALSPTEKAAVDELVKGIKRKTFSTPHGDRCRTCLLAEKYCACEKWAAVKRRRTYPEPIFWVCC